MMTLTGRGDALVPGRSIRGTGAGAAASAAPSSTKPSATPRPPMTTTTGARDIRLVGSVTARLYGHRSGGLRLLGPTERPHQHLFIRRRGVWAGQSEEYGEPEQAQYDEQNDD